MDNKNGVIDSVLKLIKNLKLENPLKRDKPGNKCYAFLKRHSEIYKRVPQSLSTCSVTVKEENMSSWFSRVQQYLIDEFVGDFRRLYKNL